LVKTARLATSGLAHADNARMRPQLHPTRFLALAAITLMLQALALTSPAALAAGPPVQVQPLAIGAPLPDVVMTGLNGPSRSLKSFVGRRLIINVWASWCGPCRAEAASLERLAWSEAGMAYTVIGISTDDDRQAAALWLKQSNATLSHFIDRDVVLERLLGASTIPLTVLVDERGRVVARVRGAKAWDGREMVGEIARAFGESPRAARR
jgi:thiol-disulfide isomerase/thioredoxin